MEERERLHLEDDVAKHKNFIKELHRLIHQFERVTSGKKHREGEDDGQDISGQGESRLS